MAERRAYRIADNKLTELGDWDAAMLRDEIAGLLAEDFDLSLLGITDADLDALLQDPDALGDDGAIEGEDDIPEAPVTPVSVVRDDMMQLQIHLHQGLLHVLNVGRGIFHQPFALAQIGPQRCNLSCWSKATTQKPI